MGVLASTAVTYGPSGPLTQTDRGGKTTTYTYDSFGRVASVMNPNSETVSFTRNRAGDITALTDAKGNTTSWTINSEGRATAKSYPAGAPYAYTYTALGQLASRTDSNSATTSYAYDSGNRLTSVTYPSDTGATFTYNSFGSKTAMTDASGSTAWTYDNFQRMTSETWTDSGVAAPAVGYTYDSAGRVTALTLGGNAHTTYSYDDMGRVSTIKIEGDLAKTFTYSYLNASNKVTGISKDGVQLVSITYDSQGRVTSRTNRNLQGAVVSTYGCTLDGSDRRTSVTDKDSKTINYGYDNAGQLLSANKLDSSSKPDSGYVYSYEYDAAGNATQRNDALRDRNFTYNTLNQPATASYSDHISFYGKAAPGTVTPSVSVGADSAVVASDGSWRADSINLASGANSVTVYARDKYNRSNTQTVALTLVPAPVFTWDNNGNLSSDSEFTHSWDTENRLLTSVKSGVSKVENTYDGQSRRRIKKSYAWTNGAWALTEHTKFLYDAWNLQAEIDGLTGNVKRKYIWGPDLSGTLQGAGGVGGLLAVVEADGSIYYPSYDLNGNITSYTSSTGATVAAYEYSPFGAITAKSGTKADDFVFKFSTKYHDKETDLSDYGYRPYAPHYARWINRDPIEEKGGYNLYGFVGNNPIDKWDYLGKSTVNSPQTKDDCDKAMESIDLMIIAYRNANPPKILFSDCDVGSQGITANYSNLPDSAQNAFSITVMRRGKLLGEKRKTLFVYNENTKKWTMMCPACLGFIRMHSVVSIEPKGVCRQWYQKHIYDYLDNSAYSEDKFKSDYNLEVNYEKPGYYLIDCKTKKPLPDQKSPAESTIMGLYY